MIFNDKFNNTKLTPNSSSRLEGRRNRLKRHSQLVNSPSSVFNDSSTTLEKKIKIEYDNRFNQYDFSLNFYTIPPFGEISLEEAQKAVEERLKILSVIDELKTELAAKRTEINYNQELNVRFKSLDDVFINEVTGGRENTKVQAARRKDHISHFLLRLLFCQNDSLKKWFIQREIDLLRYRLDNEKNTLDLVKFLIYNNLNFQEVDPKEKQILIKQNKINFNLLKSSTTNVFYKIPFEEALDLVRTRRVYLQDGYCFCSSVEMITIISSKFRLELSRSLANLMNSFPSLEENNRLLPIFQTIYTNIVKAKKTNRTQQNGDKELITPDMIDELSITSFPPCMRNIHELLRVNHHLKHYGRLHYGLFLKGIGLRLEDALTFFREEFIQSMTPEKFAKEYSYNIRYNYGKEGKKVNLSAFSCAKIINGNTPGTGDSHGCPFKHFDTNNLTKMLKKHHIDEENIKEMIDLAKQQKHTSACSNYFSCKNKGIKLAGDIYHPNQYYIESRKIAKNIYIIKEDKNENKELNDKEPKDKELNDKELKDDILKKDPNAFDGMDFDDTIEEGN